MVTSDQRLNNHNHHRKYSQRLLPLGFRLFQRCKSFSIFCSASCGQEVNSSTKEVEPNPTVDGKILHHLGSIKPRKKTVDSPYQLVQDFFHQQYHLRVSHFTRHFLASYFFTACLSPKNFTASFIIGTPITLFSAPKKLPFYNSRC